MQKMNNLRHGSPPWRLARRLIVACAPLVAGLIAHSAQSAAARSVALEEPIFGLYYYPHDVHFAELKTQELLPACQKALSDIVPLPTSLALYAQYQDNLTKLYIVGSDDNVKIYVIRHGSCDAGIPTMAILQRHHTPRETIDGPVLSDEEVNELFQDALVRYTSAFGGRKRFFQWLDSLTERARSGCKGQPESSCPPTYFLLQPPLQAILKDFRKEQ